MHQNMHSCHKYKRTWPLQILTATPNKHKERKREEMKAPCPRGKDWHSLTWILLLRGLKTFLENGWDAHAETGNTGQALERIMKFSFNVIQTLMKPWPHTHRREGGGEEGGRGRLNESQTTAWSLNMRTVNLQFHFLQIQDPSSQLTCFSGSFSAAPTHTAS